MTQGHHRTSAGVAPPPNTARSLPGGAPGGLWAVAWRLHRNQVFTLLAVAAAGAITLIIFRARVLARYHEFGCEPMGVRDGYGNWNFQCTDALGRDVWWGNGFNNWHEYATVAMLVGPVLLGAFAAAPLFTREFSRGTHTFALTQAVTRRRWMTAKLALLAVPLTAVLLLLGYLNQWVDLSFGITAGGALQESAFFTRGPIPAATGLMAFGLTTALGMVTRNLLAALIVGILAGGAVLVGVAWLQPRTLPAERATAPIDLLYPHISPQQWEAMQSGTWHWNDPYSIDLGDDRDARWLGSGYLDADGREVVPPPVQSRPGVLRYSVNSGFDQCYEAASKAAAQAVGLQWANGGAVIDSNDDAARTNNVDYHNAHNAAFRSCLSDLGVVDHYRDFWRGDMLWPLRGVVGGILVLLGAAFTAVGGWRIRSAVAKR